MAREVLDGKRSQREEDAADGGGSHVGGDAARKPERDETKSGHGATSVEADEEEEALEEAEAAMSDMEEDLETRLAEWQLDGGASGDVRAAEDAWRALESRTSSLAQELTEQLRLILEATIASKLQGDYRTGKRISMRRSSRTSHPASARTRSGFAARSRASGSTKSCFASTTPSR